MTTIFGLNRNIFIDIEESDSEESTDRNHFRNKILIKQNFPENTQGTQIVNKEISEEGFQFADLDLARDLLKD